MIRLVCPIHSCRTTWVLHPEDVDERVREVAEHLSAHNVITDAEWHVRRVNEAEIRKAHDELREHADRRNRRPRHHPH